MACFREFCMFFHFRNVIRKCRRKSKWEEKNIKSAEHAEINLNSVQYTRCLEHENAACECLRQGKHILHDYEDTPKDNTETENENGEYYAIDEFETSKYYEPFKANLTAAENEYFSVGAKETNIAVKCCKLPTPPTCYRKQLLHESDDLSVTKLPIYLRLSQNDDIVKPVSADIGDYLNPTTQTMARLHQGFVDIGDYLHPVDTDIGVNVHFQLQKDA